MAADIMQPQVAPTYGADQVDQIEDDASIDILNLTPDKEGSQQHQSASPFAESAVQEDGGKKGDVEMQEVTPEPQLLPPPRYPPSQTLVQQKLDLEFAREETNGTAAAGAAAAANGRPSVDLVADSSGDDEAPLVSMRSQDMAASAQRSGSAERTVQQQQQQQHHSAQSKLSPTSSAEARKKSAAPAANGHAPATAGKKRALEQGSGDSASSSGEEDASGAPSKRAQSASQARKKRRNVLPAIRKDQRCGHCRTCLNPQMKKACLTRRAEMMKDMDKKGDLPLSLLATIGKQSSGSAAPRQASLSAPAAADSSSEEEEEEVDPWAKDVEALNLSRSGGLPGPKRVPLFLKVLHGADTRDKRLVALKILDLSRGEALDAFTHSATGLKTLGEWVSDATASNEASMGLAKHVLGLLRKLPIDIDALRVSGIAKLLKAAGKKCPVLQEPAKQLVEIWKKLVPSESAPAVQKRPAAPASLNRQDSDSKKPKAEPQKPPAAAAPPVTRAPAGADASKAPADITQPASSQAAAGAASKSLLVAGDFAELDTPPTVFKKAVPNFPSQPVKKIQVLEGVVPKPTEDQAASEASAAAVDAAPAGSGTAPASSSAPHVTATGLSAQPKKTTVTVSIGAPSYNFGAEPTVGFTGSRLGGPPPTDRDQRSAAERAAEAAAKVPDPEPDPDAPKRVKRKSVSWANDGLLTSVRLFSLNEPCNKVGSGEAQAHEQVVPVSERAVHALRPAGFENAARKEHHNEAAALRNIHEQGPPPPAQEAEVDDTDVNPELDWCQPPLCVLWEYSQDNPQLPVARPQPGNMYACGEGSQERQEREAYRHLHPHLDFGPDGRGAPPCPEELPSAQQRPLPGQLPRRVLWDQAPALQAEPILAQPQLQPQPQPLPYLPGPPAQQQPVQAASAPASAINISSETLQQLLLSVSQKSSTGGQPGQQQGNGIQQQVPLQAMPQPQQQQQWGAPNQQPPLHRNQPSQQAPQQASVPKPVSLPAPGNINPQHPRRQQAASGASRQPDQAQQRKPPVTLKPPVQPKLAQPPVSHPPQQQRAPVVMKAPGQPNRGPHARPPGPVVLPRPAQPQYLPPPQAGQPRPAQPAPAFNQRPPQGTVQNPRPPPIQQAPRQGQGSGAQPPRPASVRPSPPVQLGPPGNASWPQQGPRGRGRALCTYFNTPRGCRKGDRCEFVHERH